MNTYSDEAFCLGIHIEHNVTSECDTKIDHNAGKACGFYCASFQNLTYLSSEKVRIGDHQ